MSHLINAQIKTLVSFAAIDLIPGTICLVATGYAYSFKRYLRIVMHLRSFNMSYKIIKISFEVYIPSINY